MSQDADAAAFAASRAQFEQVLGFLTGPDAAALTHAHLQDHLGSRGRDLIKQLMQDHLDLRASREQPRPGPVTGADLVTQVIYTTNSIESLNYQLRKIIKNRGHFPNDDAVIKLLWLAILDVEDKRAAARAKQSSKPKNQRNAPGHLIEGAVTQGWPAAINALDLAYPGRLPASL